MDDTYLQKLEFVAFDTETTGLWAPAHRIVEIGAVKFRLGTDGSTQFRELVNPERSIPKETIAIHGITDSDVRTSPTIGPVLTDFWEFCGEDSVLIAHNAMFDISFIAAESERLEKTIPDLEVLDTVNLFRSFCPGLDSYSLISLARRFNLAREQNHRAVDDAILVWKLFLKLSEDFPYVQNEAGFRRSFHRYRFDQWDQHSQDLPDDSSDLRDAITQQKRVEISYRTEGKPTHTRIIRPIRSYKHKSNYYIAAFCEQAEEERIFRLDRIQKYRVLS